jgi:hypothetical protein
VIRFVANSFSRRDSGTSLPGSSTVITSKTVTNHLLRRMRLNNFIKLKNALFKEIALSILTLLYLGLLFLLSLPAVTRKVREVKGKVRSAVNLVTAQSTGALSRVVSSTSTLFTIAPSNESF